MGLALALLFAAPKHTVQLLGPVVGSRMVPVAAIGLVLVVTVAAALLLPPLGLLRVEVTQLVVQLLGSAGGAMVV